MSHFILLSKKAVGFCNKSALHQAARNILLFPQQCLIQLSVLFLKYIENHPLQIFAFPQKFLYLRHSDLRCFLLWKMKFPCGNAAKNNAFQFIFLCHLQTGAIAAFQQAAVLLPQFTTYDRPYSVYHIAAGQIDRRAVFIFSKAVCPGRIAGEISNRRFRVRQILDGICFQKFYDFFHFSSSFIICSDFIFLFPAYSLIIPQQGKRKKYAL